MVRLHWCASVAFTANKDYYYIQPMQTVS